MICCFTDPYPDELLYSVSARFHKLMKYKRPNYTSINLFGAKTAGASIDLPQRLGHLIENLPPSHLYTVDSLIQENTLLPFYGAFLPHERVTRLKEVMEQGGRGGISTRTSIRRLKYFKFCIPCVIDDRKQYGQTYWHRIHQTPGVMVCHVHNNFLEQCNLDLRNKGVRLKFIDAENHMQQISQGTTRQLDLSNSSHRSLLQLAQDAAWLLQQRNLTCETQVLRYRCRSLLIEQGFATHTGRVREAKLNDAFREYYDSVLLDLLQCRLNIPHSWLTRFFEESRRLQYPLHYLLLIQFLQCSAERFFQLPKLSKPFGDGPWPCLNAASDHFGHLNVHECKIRYRLETAKRPVGKFHCKCGFVYSRIGPDKSTQSHYHYDLLLAVGPIWENLLMELCKSRKLTKVEMATRLGVTMNRLLRQLRRLEHHNIIVDSENNNNEAQAPRKIGMKPIFVTPEMLSSYREAWLHAVEENPKAGRTTIRRKIPKVYGWLYFRDREWLFANCPPRLQGRATLSRIDWKKQDIETVTAIKNIAAEIRSSPEYFIRVSRNAIQSKLHRNLWHSSFTRQSPLSMKALEEEIETQEDYAIRKIIRVSEIFKQEGIKPTMTRFISRARLRYISVGNPKIKEAINHALCQIAETLNCPN